MNVLLVGRTGHVLDDVELYLDHPVGIGLFTAVSVNEVDAIMDVEVIDVVIVGGGIDVRRRLEIVDHIFEASTSTTVHMKDTDSGADSMARFVNRIVAALAAWPD